MDQQLLFPSGNNTVPNNARVTEDNEIRITEEGDIRITED